MLSCKAQRKTAKMTELERQVYRLSDETSHADDHHGGGVIADKIFVSRLRWLYHHLQKSAATADKLESC